MSFFRWAAISLIVVIGVLGCFPAITCRGYPKLDSFFLMVTPFLGIFITPLFSYANQFFDTASRERWRCYCALFLAAPLALAFTNIVSVVPKPGYASLLLLIGYRPDLLLVSFLVICLFIYFWQSTWEFFILMIRKNS